MKEKKKRRLLLVVFFADFFSFSRCGVRVTLVHRRHCRCLCRRRGLADTDSESAIFSSGLLALFYLRFCGACTPFSSPRVSIRRQRSLVRSFLSFLRTRPSFSLFRLSSSPSHSQPDPDLRLRPGQCLNFGPFERMAVWSPQDVGC